MDRWQWIRTSLLAGVLLLWQSAAQAEKDKPVLVPPVDELTILDPGVDPEGKPRVLVEVIDGKKIVTIPQAVIVHKYYYTGDRSFQGPLLKGGPTIVVFHHPATGCQEMLEVQMLPGAPRITYRRDFIEYDFGERAIRLEIGEVGLLGRSDAPSVKYRRKGRMHRDNKDKENEKIRTFFAPLTRLFGEESTDGATLKPNRTDIFPPEANITDDLEGTVPTVR